MSEYDDNDDNDDEAAISAAKEQASKYIGHYIVQVVMGDHTTTRELATFDLAATYVRRLAKTAGAHIDRVLVAEVIGCAFPETNTNKE